MHPTITEQTACRWKVLDQEAAGGRREVGAGRFQAVVHLFLVSLLGVTLALQGMQMKSAPRILIALIIHRTMEFTHRWTIDDFEAKTRTFKVGLI